jgi:PAS domain S-box-containing protein
VHQRLFSDTLAPLDWRDILSGILLPCLVTALVMLGLLTYGYTATHKILRQKATEDLRAVTRIKSTQVEHWLGEQRNLMQTISTPEFQHTLHAWLAGGQRDAALKLHLLDHLNAANALDNPPSLALRDSAGRLLLAAGKMDDSAAVRQLAQEAVSSDKMVFEPLHFATNATSFEQAAPSIELGYFMPLHLPGDRSTAVSFHLRTQPKHKLYPLLQSWPNNSPSAETILFQRHGDQVLYLNPLRHLSATALMTYRPLADTLLIGSQALSKGEGVLEGTDYRGVASLAYVQPITGTPWMLAAKLDRSEVFRDLRRIVAVTVLLCGLTLLILAYWLLRRKRRAQHFHRLLAEYDDLYQHAPCGYHSLDKNGVIQRINQTELDMLGYRREEVTGKLNVRQLLTPAGLQVFQENFAKQQAGEDIVNVEFDFIRKDGSTFPVLVKSTSMRDHKGDYLFSRTVIVDLTKQKRTEALLLESREQLRELARHNDSIREVERKHMARELHDEFGQMLTLLKMNISMLQVQFDTLPDLVDKTEEMRLLVERIIQMVRHVASNLRPAALDLGLHGALEWLAADFARNTGITCNYSGQEQNPQLDEAAATAIFRITQESLTNVARHANASRVNIRLRCDHETLHLNVSDNGCGFDVDQITAGCKGFGLLGMMGLLGMQERISMLDGRFHIHSQPGQGTRIDIEIPLTQLVPQ